MEIWKSIPNYEGLYEVSNLGNVKSLSRKVFNNKYYRITKDKLLKPGISSGGYPLVVLCKNNSKKTRTVHQLVAESFLGHTPCGYTLVVDHINDVRNDNRVENLQVVTNRFNTFKTQGKYSSKYKGVFFNKRTNKYEAQIWSELRVSKRIGQYNTELEASNAYQEYLKKII